MQITSLLSNWVHIYICTPPAFPQDITAEVCSLQWNVPDAWQQLFYLSLSAVMAKACGSFAQSRDLKKHEGAHLGPSRCGKSHERLLPGSKLPRLASPDTRRHPDECDNQKQTPKKTCLPEGCACLHFHTLHLQYIIEPAQLIYIYASPFLKMAICLSKVMFFILFLIVFLISGNLVGFIEHMQQ